MPLLLPLVFLLLPFAAHAIPAAATAEQTLFSGATAMSTPWQSESDRSIFVDISFDHLGLSSPPAVISRILHRGGVDMLDPIANVTGFFTPRKISKAGFRLRLKYADGDARNLTTTTAKIADWRVGWVAATNRHPGLMDKTPFELRVELFKQFVNEDPALIRAFLGQDYYPMLRNHPKPLPPKKPLNETVKTNSTTTKPKTANTSAGDEKASSPSSANAKEKTTTTDERKTE